ncbi:MAG: hypothetical protein MUD08_15080 [Cytophagales bacterium]|nr:hypothetical protein [Cytophagales bacterium]
MKKGKPSGEGRSKAGSKPVLDLEIPELHEEIRENYTDGPDQPAANVRVMNPNRNTDKPDIDNNKYN